MGEEDTFHMPELYQDPNEYYEEDELKTVIFGIGSGRCGTMSLEALLNLQCKGGFSHEYGRTWTRWGEDREFMYRILTNILTRSGDFVGDISFYHLPNIRTILNLNDRNIKNNVRFKVVCLKRNKDDVFRSFMKATDSKRGLFNHWTERNHPDWLSGKYIEYGQWDPMYPKYQLPKEEGIRKYYDDYYDMAYKLEKLFPNNFRVFVSPHVLNDEIAQKEMFEFIGMKNYECRLNIRKNVQFK